MRKFIHIDMDSFYASVEMRDNPALRNLPIAVGGDVKKRGVISTANYIARQYGVRSALPTAQALKLCPMLKVITPRYDVYKSISYQIRSIMLRYTHLIEFVSLDEAYLDVTDCTLYQGSATLIAQAIRHDINKELDLTASAGIAPVKFLAKIASDMNKPNGQFVIPPQSVDEFVHSLELAKIPGVGKVSAKKLADLGMIKCSDVLKYDLAKLIREFGKLGSVIYERSHGIDERTVNIDRERKSIGVERTLSEDIHSWNDCLSEMKKIYDELEARLSKVRSDLSILKQGVKIKFDDFQITTQEHIHSKLEKEDLIDLAQTVWNERRQDRGVRLVGMHVSLIGSQLAKQLRLPEI